MSVRERLGQLALSLPDVHRQPCWGEEGYFFHPPGSKRRLGHLFLSLRNDPLRVSLPLPRETYLEWFGRPPPRPRRREPAIPGGRKGPFRPHPVYAWNAWVQVVEPQDEDLEALAWAVREAYGLVVGREA